MTGQRVTLLSADERIKCVVEEIEPGRVRYTLWHKAGTGGLDSDGTVTVMWRRDGSDELCDLPWHEALDRLERCVRPMTYERPKQQVRR